MHRSDWKSVLAVAAPAALAHLESLPHRPVHPAAAYADVRAALDHGLPETGLDSTQVVRDLVRDLGPYVTAHASAAGIRAEGTAFFSGTTYRGERLMRISVSDWATDEDDVDRVVAALLRQAQLARG
jgi:7-keto-8-aminopelargonate synthetase-like enzyme